MVKSQLRRVPDELLVPDGNGGKVKLLGTGVIEYSCASCRANWWMRSNTAVKCPNCGNTEIKSRWTTPVTAFLPQVKDEE